MPSLDLNLERWITASVSVYLKSVAAVHSIPLLMEGVDDRSDAFEESPDRAEGRIVGILTQELSQGYHRVWTDINVLVTSNMGGAAKNKHTLFHMNGVFRNGLQEAFSILKYGDDESPVGCMVARPGKSESVKVFNFGQVSRTDRVRQSVVDARYVMYLKN